MSTKPYQHHCSISPLSFSLFRGTLSTMTLISALAFAASSALAREYFVYFGSYTGAKSKGIHVSRFDSKTGILSEPRLVAETKNPTFLALHPKGRYLYAVGEISEFDGKKSGAVSAYAVDAETGDLQLLNQQISGGTGPCHLSLDSKGRCVLVANYGSGSVAVLPVEKDGRLGELVCRMQHNGSGVNPRRQEGPHAHFVTPDPDNRRALVCDLGLDKIFVYRLEAKRAEIIPNTPLFATVPPGAGPRHLVFSADEKFVFVINEMGSSITVFSYDSKNGSLASLQTISTLPEGFSGDSTCAEIALHPSGKFLYASNRGHDSIAVYAVDEQSGRLKLVQHEATRGNTPRHFAIDPTGNWLLVENQNSDNVAVFGIDAKTGALKFTDQTVSIGSPVCAVFVPAK